MVNLHQGYFEKMGAALRIETLEVHELRREKVRPQLKLVVDQALLQKDPHPGKLEYPGTVINSYAYCLNNPVMFTDPSGRFIPILLAIGKILLDVAITAAVTAAIQTAVGAAIVSAAGGTVDGGLLLSMFFSNFKFNFLTGGVGGLAAGGLKALGAGATTINYVATGLSAGAGAYLGVTGVNASDSGTAWLAGLAGGLGGAVLGGSAISSGVKIAANPSTLDFISLPIPTWVWPTSIDDNSVFDPKFGMRIRAQYP